MATQSRTPSNSTLSKLQKDVLKEWVKRYLPSFFHYPAIGVTVAIVPEQGTWVKVGISFCSKDEKKYRPSVGEFHALGRVGDNEAIRVPLASSEYQDFADYLVDTLDVERVSRETKNPTHAGYKDYPAYKAIKKQVKDFDESMWPEVKETLKKAYLSPDTTGVDPTGDALEWAFLWASTPQGMEYWDDLHDQIT